MGNTEFYRLAKAYDIAFSDRDFSSECDFLIWCFEQHAAPEIKSDFPLSFFELAAGPSNHARIFAQRSWKTGALDLSADMIDYAKQKDADENVSIDYFLADMNNFSVPNEYHLAANLMESICHILTNDNMVSHLRSVAASLKKGGIYVIEATHPRHYFPDEHANTWSLTQGNATAHITFGTPDDPFDSVTQQYLVTTRLTLHENGGEPLHTESRSPHRWFLAQEIKALIDLSGAFEQYWFYGTAAIPPHPFDSSDESDSMMIVLRK